MKLIWLIKLRDKILLDGSIIVTCGLPPLTEIVNSTSLESTDNI